MFGTVNFFHPRRGFGFIRTSPDAEDIFFHCCEFEGDEAQLVKGVTVEFDLAFNRSKQVARNIRLLQGQDQTTETVNGGAQ
jgi:CspA family cold shock protein